MATISAGYLDVADRPVVSRDGTIYLHDDAGRTPNLKAVRERRRGKLRSTLGADRTCTMMIDFGVVVAKGPALAILMQVMITLTSTVEVSPDMPIPRGVEG